MSGAKFTRSSRLVQPTRDPLDWYRSIVVSGYGWEAEAKTTDIISVDELLDIWDHLEAELREEIKREEAGGHRGEVAGAG